MAKSQSAVLEARNRYGVVKRHHADNPDLVAEAQRALAAAKLASYIEQTIASAPPLTAAQRDRLALLLRGEHDAA